MCLPRLEISHHATVWDRKERGGFLELAELKRLVRDVIAPDRELGHSDHRPAST